MNETNPERSGSRRSTAALLVGLAIGALAMALVSSGIAVAGGLFGHRGWHARGAHHEQAGTEHLERALDRGLRWLDTSDLQNDQIRTLVLNHAEVFSDFRDQHRAQREALVAWFGTEELAPEGLAEIRSQSLALAEQTASEIEQMVLELAPILTVEQRRELIEDLSHFRHH